MNNLEIIGQKKVKTLIQFWLKVGGTLFIGVEESPEVVKKMVKTFLEKDDNSLFTIDFVQGKKEFIEPEHLILPRSVALMATVVEFTESVIQQISNPRDIPPELRGRGGTNH